MRRRLCGCEAERRQGRRRETEEDRMGDIGRERHNVSQQLKSVVKIEALLHCFPRARSLRSILSQTEMLEFRNQHRSRSSSTASEWTKQCQVTFEDIILLHAARSSSSPRESQSLIVEHARSPSSPGESQSLIVGKTCPIHRACRSCPGLVDLDHSPSSGHVCWTVDPRRFINISEVESVAKRLKIYTTRPRHVQGAHTTGRDVYIESWLDTLIGFCVGKDKTGNKCELTGQGVAGRWAAIITGWVEGEHAIADPSRGGTGRGALMTCRSDRPVVEIRGGGALMTCR
ncbi:hypothetical protein RRG08_027829 [Elysia crispata]|uniref:Uncharacterized protein n=1 Tax=Elysia crispata TaxID=231223 RepID=A0AAE1EE59_9GAST|nr:hypothetical protein RRG08_027829 [Elysia crispata]